MKKEIPRMLRSASTVYAFDLFQTILHRNLKSIFSAELLFNPHKLGIRWIIISNLPKILYPFIKFLCYIKGLNPIQIILSDQWFKSKDTNNFVLNTIMNITNNKIILNYVKPDMIRRIRYISNNVNLIRYINSNVSTLENNILAETVVDFWDQKFESVI